MFNQVQTFLSKLFHYKQMFDRLVTMSHKANCESGKKQPITSGVYCVSRHNFSGNIQKAFYGLNLFDVWSKIVCPFNLPLTILRDEHMLDENVWSFNCNR